MRWFAMVKVFRKFTFDKVILQSSKIAVEEFDYKVC